MLWENSIWQHIYAMNGRIPAVSADHTTVAVPNFAPTGHSWADRGACAACVPAGDKRSSYLPTCSVQQAACRTLFFTPPLNHTNAMDLQCPIQILNETHATHPAVGCPSNVQRFAITHSIWYP